MTELRSDHLPLAAEFPPVTRQKWAALVEAVLKGVPFERKLVAKTYDRLTIQPLYDMAPQAQPMAGRAPGVPWQILQRIDHPDPAAANVEALHDRDNGASGFSLVFAGSIGSYDYGLAASEATIARALDGVHLEEDIPLELDLGAQAEDAGRIVASLVESRGAKPGTTAIRFGFDPLGAMAASGANLPEPGPRLAGLVGDFAARGFKGPFAAADGRVIDNAGGSEAQELGFVIAVATSYLRALEAAGIALEDARSMIFFRLTADADQFMTIAKFAALRRLWARVEQACGLNPAPAFVSAETAWRMMTQRDPHVNILRATIAAFAAGLGGANAISVLPFTLARGLPDRFARRVARNTQLILLEESNLAKVADTITGAGAIEDLTEQLCRAGWALFQEIEQAGGAPNALETGLIQAKIASVRREREAAVARRTDPLVGTSNFPDLTETPVEVLDVAPVPTPHVAAVQAKNALLRIRLAEPFERLRDRSDRMLSESGSRPRIFLAGLGKLAEFTARRTFAKNFFEAGGIAAVTDEDLTLPPRGAEVTTDLAGLAAAFASSGATLACLCSSDEIYASEAAAAARTLAEAGAHPLYLAGRPRDLERDLREAGVGSFIYAGCDVVAVLQAAYEQMESR
jgi:methylmalonyl-CoA mutase